MKKNAEQPTTKLGIARETVRSLTPIAPADLNQVAGGTRLLTQTRTKTNIKER